MREQTSWDACGSSSLFLEDVSVSTSVISQLKGHLLSCVYSYVSQHVTTLSKLQFTLVLFLLTYILP